MLSISLNKTLSITVCSCYVTLAFQSESTVCSCLNAKELLARSRREIWRLSNCNWTRTQNHLVRKRTLTHLASLAKWLSVRLRTKWFWVRIRLQSFTLSIADIDKVRKRILIAIAIILAISSELSKVSNPSAIIFSAPPNLAPLLSSELSKDLVFCREGFKFPF